MTTTGKTYCEYTGRPVAEGVAVPESVRLGLEPPRYCGFCGRRMIVQVSPHGWTARCSRHGERDSSDASLPWIG
ncbi:hypothetical protein P0W64_01165 [Tsukamurella sp. 8F]|uniref:biotin synthase auxiliary protein BsaP n=1 Tax=unclassified Tsukamurella TaxID=2633480 RepID=UPI0023B89BA6|nr:MULTISPECIES: hypothetical protein [unclassified Tsukamurella]MDF0529195.1 hypothetical protein [Tsukamurella sp. 8J]MDF0585380.1 hypothetical protein [Tsukamurella sp. 8F]